MTADFTDIPTGDMPGDSIQIGPTHVAKASTVYPRLRGLIDPVLTEADGASTPGTPGAVPGAEAVATPAPGRNVPQTREYGAETSLTMGGGRAVVSVYGGSGVGKSEIASVLAEMLRRDGIGAYVMSGDNYPHRIPAENDAERSRRYESGGRTALARYLGSPDETDFDQVNAIIKAFHAGAPRLRLKRMGRTPDAIWHDDVDVTDTRVLVIEWTHGNNPRLTGIDAAVYLHSTPEETLAHRRARARDGATDSPFTQTVLELEQSMLDRQLATASIIVAKDGRLLSHEEHAAGNARTLDASPMLNAYPDSLGGRLTDLVELLARPELAETFGSLYLLPSLFHSDLDRGFSVIDYGLNEVYATREDLQALSALGVDLKLDFVLNHASVLSPQFQDLLARGEDSEFADFFIDWNRFWDGHGQMTAEGYVQPDAELLEHMFFRKPGLPFLMVRLPDGTERPYWNTFYQQVTYPMLDAQDLMPLGLQHGTASAAVDRLNPALAAGERPGTVDLSDLPGAAHWASAVTDHVESRRRYLGQMDLDIRSPKVWEFYTQVLAALAGYGARIVRLDAFAYAPKEPGARNFLNEPGTWEVLERVRGLAERDGLTLLPEIHATYGESLHRQLADKGYLVYDFFLPGLIIHALATGDATYLVRWMQEVLDTGMRTVTMLGCHDGIPVLDLRGLLPEAEIQRLITTVTERGGIVKDLHGAKNLYYQVNATYYSALGATDAAMLLARAIQLFTPGKPQVWYLDLFAGENDIPALARGHKEINRTNLSTSDLEEGLERPVVRDQLDLLRFRRTFPAFGFDARCEVSSPATGQLVVEWTREGAVARLEADLTACSFAVTGTAEGNEAFLLERRH